MAFVFALMDITNRDPIVLYVIKPALLVMMQEIQSAWVVIAVKIGY